MVYARSELPEGKRGNAEAIGANLVSVDRGCESRAITDDYRSYRPTISSSGKEIAFTRARPSSTQFGPGYFVTSFIHAMDADGGGERRLTSAPEGLDMESSDGTWLDDHPDLSPDGERVAFLREVSRYPENGEETTINTSSIQIVDFEADDEPRRLALRDNVQSRAYGPPTFLPDGQRVAFADMREDVAWAVDVESGERERLFSANDLGLNSLGPEIEWSPEGDELVIQGGKEPQGRYRTADVDTLGIVELDGAAGPSFRELPDGAGPTWTRDGEHVVVNRREGLTALPT